MSLADMKLSSELGRDERIFRASNYLYKAGVESFNISTALKTSKVSISTLLSYYKEIYKNYDNYLCGHEVLKRALNEATLLNFAPSKRAEYMKHPKY